LKNPKAWIIYDWHTPDLPSVENTFLSTDCLAFWTDQNAPGMEECGNATMKVDDFHRKTMGFHFFLYGCPRIFFFRCQVAYEDTLFGRCQMLQIWG